MKKRLIALTAALALLLTLAACVAPAEGPGGTDGPTAVFVTGNPLWMILALLAVVAVAAAAVALWLRSRR